MIRRSRNFAATAVSSALLASAVCLAFSARRVEAAGPEIRFDKEILALGEVIRGQEVEAEFVYRNLGDQSLKILKAKPG